MSPPTFNVAVDYHEQMRTALVEDLTWIMTQGWLNNPIPVVPLDDPNTDPASVTDLPAIIVACVGPEAHYPQWDTNLSDGIGYSCAVILMASGVTSGNKNVPDLTQFRRQLQDRYNNQRLAGIPYVSYCEVSDSGPLYDKDSPAFQKLQTAMIVTGVGRFPHTRPSTGL